MDILNKNKYWIQALNLLFEACNSISDVDLKLTNENISLHTFYCLYVKECIKIGETPLNWDDYYINHKNFSNKEYSCYIDKLELDSQIFGTELSNIFKNKKESEK